MMKIVILIYFINILIFNRIVISGNKAIIYFDYNFEFKNCEYNIYVVQ
jgi:hypothetical protein